MIKVLLYLWQLPQNILGLILLLLSKQKKYSYCRYYICSIMPGYDYGPDRWSAISLGNYILASRELSPEALFHERGHQVQSIFFGPLYLILVGIPSMLRAIIKIILRKDNHWYHSGYPENWADKLGNQRQYWRFIL